MMSSKFHVNEKGVVSRCDAKIKCRLGGESGLENHYDSIQEARAGYEKSMADKTHSSFKKDYSDRAKYPGESEAFYEKNSEYNKVRAEIEKSKRVIPAIVKKNPNFKNSRKWFEMVQKEKEAVYKRECLHLERVALLSEKGREKFSPESLTPRKFTSSGDYNYHPEVDATPKDEKAAFDALVAYSGRSPEVLSASIQEKIESGLSKTEAYRQVWNENELRKDKPIVSIDLEAASPKGSTVDTGKYSSIIEVGYIKQMPDGTTVKKNYLCGVPEDLEKTHGTGAEHIHNISVDMVKGKKVFVEDKERQRELLKDLDGSLIVAHNARYETTQFSHNLFGFNKLVSDGRVEVLDTRDVVKYYLPESPTNTNEDFVATTGGTYEGAHRAFEDASMTFEALKRMSEKSS